MEKHSPAALSCSQQPQQNESEFNLREWALKARLGCKNTNSRRFSASNLRSFREDTRSFRSHITLSSTASSPGYTLREEIDPSTYSFTTALKALQAKPSVYSWDCLSPDGFALNSKWSEAEKYICNPLSGEVPIECLSAKTLSGRWFRQYLTSRITMSAPLIYPSQSRFVHPKPSLTANQPEIKLPIQEKKIGSKTRDIGTQSTPPELSSSSRSSSPTPPIVERSIKHSGVEDRDSPNFRAKLKAEEKVEVKEIGEDEKSRSGEEEEEGGGRKSKQMWRCRRQGGCLLLSWKSLWRKNKRAQREEHKPRKKNILLCHFSGF